MLSDPETAAPSAVGLLKHAVPGTHDTIDHCAYSETPAMRHLSDSPAAAQLALQVKTNPLSPARSAWFDSLHSPVHNNPLVSVAAAFALGPVVFFVPA